MVTSVLLYVCILKAMHTVINTVSVLSLHIQHSATEHYCMFRRICSYVLYMCQVMWIFVQFVLVTCIIIFSDNLLKLITSYRVELLFLKHNRRNRYLQTIKMRLVQLEYMEYRALCMALVSVNCLYASINAKDNTGIPPLRQNNQLITDAKEKADTLNNRFYSIFTDGWYT